MQITHDKMLPSMVHIARQALGGLGFLAVCFISGGVYFYQEIAAHRQLGYYAGREALLTGEITIAAEHFTPGSAGYGLKDAGVAYAELDHAIDALERNHQALRDEYTIVKALHVPTITAEVVSQHAALIAQFVIAARALLYGSGGDIAMLEKIAGEVIAVLEIFTDQAQASEQRTLMTIVYVNLCIFAALIVGLIWFWYARLRPIFHGATLMVMQAQEVSLRLMAEEERAKVMLQFSSDAVVAFDESGIINSFNLSAETVFGYQSEDILGQPVKVLMSETEVFSKFRHIRDFKPRDLANFANGIQIEGKRKGGELFSARLIVNEIWSKGRRGFVATIHDLTDEIAAQNQLQEALERFDLCVRGSDSAIWDFDPRSGTLFVAPRLMQLLGYGDELAINSMSGLLEIVHPDDQKIILTRADEDSNSSNTGFENRFRLRARNGEYLWFQNKAAYRRDTKGALVRIAGSITEITARVNAEEELRRHRDHLVKMVDAQTRHIKKSEARLATAISGISEGLCLVDENKLIILVNKHMLDLYPEVTEILNPGVALDDLFLELLEKNRHDGARIKFITDHFEILRGDSPSEELPRQGGGWMRISRSHTADGGEIILHTDITHYKEQQVRLHAQARELENALSAEKEINNLHKQFVSMASHEFRTPLAIIDGSAQLLAREAERLTPERVAQRAEKIRGAVSRMTNLIESTLTVARLDAGKVDIAPRECDLRALITEVCERQQELAPAHRLDADLDGLPDRIIADSKAIDQVMTNLFSNAVKYAPNNPDIHIRGWREGAFAVVSVRDHGLGIAAEDMSQIFSRFFRAQNSTGIVGTGIGLNLVKELVGLHGGVVEAESRVGEGSTFTVYLPVQGPQASALKAAS